MHNSSNSAVHTSRRAGAAAAAAAAEMVPINSKKAAARKKSVAVRESSSASSSTGAGPSRPTAATPLTAVRGVPDFAAAAPNALPDFHALQNGDGASATTASTGRESRPPAAPPTTMECDASGNPPLLQSRAGIDSDEVYGSQEQALSQYLKLHPVLSLESTSCQTLQLVADLVETTSMPTRELEVVPKSHDDQFLRPPNTSIGERGCCLGNRCICVWMARWRYGETSDMAFVGTEFLLPSELATFRKSGTLPATNGKCLVCSRYVHTFIYRCARADPTFKPERAHPAPGLRQLARRGGAATNVPTHSERRQRLRRLPARRRMLFVDEHVGRHGGGARQRWPRMLWRPVVQASTRATTPTSRTPTALPRVMPAQRERCRGRASDVAFLPAGRGSQRPPLPASTSTPPPSPPSLT